MDFRELYRSVRKKSKKAEFRMETGEPKLDDA
jgi:hypothetical protein